MVHSSYWGDWSVTWARVISVGTCCRNVTSLMACQPPVLFFHLSLVPFCSEAWHFPNSQVSIKHSVSVTEKGGVCGAKSGKQLTLFLWQARKLCRIWQERLHEVPQRKAFIYLLCRTVIYLFIFCYSKTSLHFSASATSLAFPLF